MQENIVVLTFAEDSKAYQALSELKQAAVQSRVQVRNAAVIARDAAGEQIAQFFGTRKPGQPENRLAGEADLHLFNFLFQR